MSKKKDKLRKLKRVTIKEEMVALTGDYVKALLLQQFIYWSDRIDDCEEYIEEELKRITGDDSKADVLESSGWIYKSATELSDELMLNMSSATIGRHMKVLLEKGWILERNNPDKKWDRTKQYRVDLIKVQVDLLALGYFLEGYQIHEQAFFILKDAIFKMKNGDFNLKAPTVENEKAIPEITSEILEDRLIDSYNGQGNKDDSKPKEPQSDGMPSSVPGAVQEEISLPDVLGRIEELFVYLCGKYMGDKDYQTAVFLIKSGIPLQTILDGMNQVAKNKKKSDPQSWNDIKSLAYFKKPIQQLHSERMAKEQAIKELAAMVPDLRGEQPGAAATVEPTSPAQPDPNVDAELEALLAKMKGDQT